MNFLFSRKAQSGLEYTTMAVLVTLGILLMGPYVVRSINSQFKATEEGAKDSQREQITQAPEQNVQLPNCNCTDLLDDGCGVGATSANCLAVSESQVASQCGQRCKVFERQCDPMGCDVDMRRLGVIGSMLECRNDPDAVCCEPLISTGLCGAQGLNTPGGRCPDGRMKWYKDCGSPTSTRKYECIVDPACDFRCSGTPDGNSTECSNTRNDLLGNMPWTYTKPASNCSDSPKCLAACNTGFVPIAGGCIAHCPNGICEDGNGGRPNYGETVASCPDDCICANMPVFCHNVASPSCENGACFNLAATICLKCVAPNIVAFKVQAQRTYQTCAFGVHQSPWNNDPSVALGPGCSIRIEHPRAFPDGFIAGQAAHTTWLSDYGNERCAAGYAQYNGATSIEFGLYGPHPVGGAGGVCGGLAGNMWLVGPLTMSWDSNGTFTVCDPNTPGNPCSGTSYCSTGTMQQTTCYDEDGNPFTCSAMVGGNCTPDPGGSGGSGG